MIITIKVQNRQIRYRDDKIDQKRFEGYFGERRELLNVWGADNVFQFGNLLKV